MELIDQQVVDGVDVVEIVVGQRLSDQLLVQAGQLEHVVDDGFVGLLVAFVGARVDRRSIGKPAVFRYLGEGEPFLRLDDEHVADEVFAV